MGSIATCVICGDCGARVVGGAVSSAGCEALGGGSWESGWGDDDRESVLLPEAWELWVVWEWRCVWE